jgi:hypothetical protein
MSWFGTRGIVLTKGYGFRNSSGSFSSFASSLLHHHPVNR